MFNNFPGATGLLDDGPVGILVSRLGDGLMVESNAVFAHTIGYSRYQVIGASVASLQLWVDPLARADMVAHIQQDGHFFNVPVDLRHKSGQILRVLCSALRIDVEGVPHILTVVHDPRGKSHNRTARDNEAESLDSAEATSGLGFWDYDTPSGLVRWSYGMEAIYGLPKGGFKGTAEDFNGRIHPDDVARNLRESQAALERRSHFDIRFRILRTDGQVRWVCSRGAGRFGVDGALLGASGFHLDITEEVQREQHMQLQSRIITTMAEGVVLVGAQTGRILHANPRYEQMLGYPSGGLEGLPVDAVNARTGDDPVAVTQAIMAELRAHGTWRGEVKNRCTDGREIWTSCTVTEMDYEGLGKVWVGVQTDITGQRAAQAAREEALQEVQRLSLNIQETVEAERLALSLEVHDQLGAALTGMRMQLEALATQLQGVDPALEQQARRIVESAGQTQRAARDICSRLHPALLDDMGLGEACRWYLKEWSRQSGVPVRTRLGALPQAPDLKQATDMFRVLQELLTNVARHAGARAVRVALSGNATGLKLRVQDDGCGFDTSQKTPGFGLPGMRQRLRHHGGALHIASGAQGTVVTATMALGSPP